MEKEKNKPDVPEKTKEEIAEELEEAKTKIRKIMGTQGMIMQCAVTIENLLEEVNISGRRNMEMLLQSIQAAEGIIGAVQSWPAFAEERKEE